MLQDEPYEPPTDPPPASGASRRAEPEHAAALERLGEEIRQLRELVVDRLAPGAAGHDAPQSFADGGETGGTPPSSLLDDTRWRLEESNAENARLSEQVHELQTRLSELEQQNGDLASQVAGSNIRKSVAEEHSDCTEALSWEQRKSLILQQMENDSFDPQAFVESLPSSASTDQASADPAAFVEQLHQEMQRRDEEIEELRCLLEQQSGAREGGVAVGAAAIAQMVDADELVQEERQRLQQLQAEWEEKFRQGEIAASLERAKLSRERQELARKNEELEEQLAHLRRECQSVEPGSRPSRRWLAKLGLSEAED